MENSAALILVGILALAGCHESPNAPKTAATSGENESDKRLLVAVDGKSGYIDGSGKLVINPQYESASDFAEGLALICVGECSFEHIVGYRWTKDFTREPVEQTFKYGFVGKDGKIVINPTFEIARSFSEGLAAVCVGHGCYANFSKTEEAKWGYIGKDGKTAITPQFDSAGDFHEGLAAVSVGGKFGYIDKTGKFVVNPQYDFAYEFKNGVAQVGFSIKDKDKDKPTIFKYGYVNKEGKLIWQPSN